MAKISEQKKVELLEAAVLNNDADAVNALFKEHGEFEFTARALGLAMRFGGIKIVTALLDNGATLKYEMTPAFKRKYNSRISINKLDDLAIDYTWYLFPTYKLSEYDNPIVEDNERVEILKNLYNRKEGDFQEILYYAILFDDQCIYNALKDLGVNKLSDYRTDIAAGLVLNNSLDAYGRYARREFQEYVIGTYSSQISEEETVRKLKRYWECMDVEKICLFPSDFYEPDFKSPMVSGKFGTLFSKRFCSEVMFGFFIQHTNMLEKVKKWDLLFALVDQNNAYGVQYALSEKWISKAKDLDTLLSYAQERSNIKPELIGYILEKQNKAKLTQGKKKGKGTELSLDEKPLSATEMKKIWGCKKRDDGTIIITSYKGDETDIVIPSAIGKDTVTAIDPDTFSTTAPRVTEIQKKVRKAIVSVEFPGTIKSIPTHMFYDGYTGYYNNSNSPHANLKRIIINEGTEIISEKAFEDCNGLEEILIPESVSEIGDGVFSGCWGLKTIKLPQAITRLSNNMFEKCGFESFEIPERITEFGYGIFNNCWNLSVVKMSDNVSEITDSMFAHCRSLKTFKFSKSITKIGKAAFHSCPFEYMVIPDTVTTIGRDAFAQCNALKSVHVPTSVELGDDVFAYCNGLANENGQIIINGILFGLKDNGYGRLSAETAIKPLEIRSEIKAISVGSRDRLPEIVYREHFEKGETINVNDLSVGDEVSFGRFPDTEEYIMRPLKWRVIGKENGKALLITVHSIISQSDELKQTGVWADCYVRKLLNEGFYKVAFTEIEREQIVVSMLDNPGNKDQRVDGGPPTEDRVFLLSLDEVERYMPTEEDRKSTATEYAHKQILTRRDCGFWQLRTPGKGSWGSVAIDESGYDVAMTGNHVDHSYLRPAIWIK